MGNYHVRFGGRERRVLIEARPSRPNAEIGAGLCCADLGLPNVLHDSHASYVAHWLGILRGDKTASYGTIMTVMGAINAAGYKRIGLVALQETGG